MEIPASDIRVGDTVRAAPDTPGPAAALPHMTVRDIATQTVGDVTVLYLTSEDGSSGYSLYPHEIVWREDGPNQG